MGWWEGSNKMRELQQGLKRITPSKESNLGLQNQKALLPIKF